MKTTSNIELETGLLDKLIEKHQNAPGALLGILEEAQELHPHKYLPRATLEHVAGRLDVPLSRIFSVSSFYAFFNLKPQGQHTIVVCRGTACHTKGSKGLLEHLESTLGVRGVFDEGESFFTTPDNQFTIRTVACFGQCALAPIVVLDGKIYVHMNAEKLSRILQPYTRGGVRA